MYYREPNSSCLSFLRCCHFFRARPAAIWRPTKTNTSGWNELGITINHEILTDQNTACIQHFRIKMSHQSDVSNAHPLADIHSTGAADATQPAAVSLKLRLEHYPSTSSADESIGELPAPRDVSCLSRTLSSEPASPLSTGRSQV